MPTVPPLVDLSTLSLLNPPIASDYVAIERTPGVLQKTTAAALSGGPTSITSTTGNQIVSGANSSTYYLSGDASPVVFTVNSAGWAALGNIIIRQGAAGQVQLSAGANVSLNFWITGHIGTGGQNALITLECTGIVGGTAQIAVDGATA